MIALSAALLLAFFFQQAPATYEVAGTVVDAVTGAPLSNAHVSLSGAAAVVVTGRDGRFRFEKILPGTHQLTAERIGYSPQSYAQHSLTAGLSTGIVTGENQPTLKLVFRMLPGASIAGYLRDANGQPVAGMTVNAYRIYGTGKNHRLGGSYVGSTDDRGYYRIHPPAGAYAIVATGHPVTEIASVQPMTYPVTFYPGGADPSTAALVSVKPGEEARADMTLRAVPAVSIVGEVPSAAGRAPGNLYAAITAPALFGAQVGASGTANVFAGKFTFANMAAGRYHVQLIQRAGDEESARVLGGADVEATTDPSNVSIGVASPQKVSLHLTVRGQPKTPTARLVAQLNPIEGPGGGSAAVGPDGRAIFPYVRPGRYALEASMGSRLAMQSVAVDGTAQPGIEVEIPETGPVEIEAVASTATVDVAGRVSKDGTPVAGILALVVQRDTWERIGLYRYDQSDSDGTFAWRDLPPGAYLAFALQEGEPADYDSAEALRELMPVAQPLVLTSEVVQKVELKLLALPAK